MKIINSVVDFFNIGQPVFHGFSEWVFLGIGFLFIIFYIINAIRNRSFSLAIFLSILGVIFIFWVAFCAPDYFIDEGFPLYSAESSNTGMSIDGLMSPFIAIGAAILTFIAFWVQHTANQEMLRNHAKQQIERQFYELLKIHREMVGEFEWSYLDSEKEDPSSFQIFVFKKKILDIKGHSKNFAIYRQKGQSAVRMFLKELNFTYVYLRTILEDKEKEDIFKIAYNIFFEGLEDAFFVDSATKNIVVPSLKDLKNNVNKNGLEQTIDNSKYKFKRCNLWEGHRSELNPYYRHLFLMVKTVATSDYFSKEEKLSYLKILRAQMTSEEQMLLLYNWLSGYGTEWEEKKGNRFFTKFKMIHNIETGQLDVLGMQFFFDQFPWMSEDEKIGLFEWYDRIVKQQTVYEYNKAKKYLIDSVKMFFEELKCCIWKKIFSGSKHKADDNDKEN